MTSGNGSASRAPSATAAEPVCGLLYGARFPLGTGADLEWPLALFAPGPWTKPKTKCRPLHIRLVDRDGREQSFGVWSQRRTVGEVVSIVGRKWRVIEVEDTSEFIQTARVEPA